MNKRVMRTAFVPKFIFRTVCASVVVPVLAACGGSDQRTRGVAAVGYEQPSGGSANATDGAAPVADAGEQVPVATVAAVGFQGASAPAQKR
jgi:hypothetical protein